MKEEMKELLKNTKQVSKITVGGTYLSINTLNINELKSSSKKHEVYKQKKKMTKDQFHGAEI